jgi:hypothetical protein
MLVPALLLALSLPQPAPDGAAVLREINAAHRASWFRSMIFVQRTTFPSQPGRPDETWYETMVRPGYLRIDMERVDSAIGRMIFRNDTLYQAAPGQPAGVGRPLVHSLLVLLHDIHVGDIEAAIATLRAQGFDLATTGSTTWEGRAITVVGAAADDTTTAQFWVDTGRQVVVRVLQPTPNGLSDTRVTRFSETDAGLVERQIEFRTNGTIRIGEEYTWIQVGEPVDMAVFEPGHAALPAWVTARKAAVQ